MDQRDALFGPNNHSVFQIGWKEIDPARHAALVEILRSQYGAERVDDIRQVDEWERMSNNFRVQGIFGGEAREILLRMCIQVNDPESLRLMGRISDHLRENGVPTPRIVCARDGSRFVMDGNRSYQAFEFISGDHFCGTEEELKEAARGIASMHRALERIPFAEDIERKPSLFAAWSRAEWEAMKAVASERRNPVDMLLLDSVDGFIDAAARREEGIRGRRQVIHADMHPQNVIFEGGKLKVVLDFESARMGELARDVGNACHRFVRQYVVHQAKPWNETLSTGVSAFLSAYEEINPLTADERFSVPALIRDELLYKLFAKARPYYATGDDRFIAGGELEKMINLLREVECIERALLGEAV